MLRKSPLNRASFGTFNKIIDTLACRGSTDMWRKANADPKRHDSPFPVTLLTPQERQVKVTRLDNGVRVVSETPALPGTVTMGVHLDVGSRNETHETSGALFSIKSTMYKTNLHTNETINNHMIQQAGGSYDVTFDRERTLFKASSLSHDVQDVMSMVADCVLEPRSSVTANVAIGKMSHLRKVLPYKYPGLLETDKIFGAIFGEKGLGMPLHGSDKNDVNLNAYTLQKFQIENYSPERIIVGGIGVDNHGEFVSLVEEHFGSIRYGSKLHAPEKQEFQEVELKISDAESHKHQVLLLFESVPHSAKEFLVSALVREYFGSADVGNPAVQSGNNGVFVTDFYNKEKSIHSAEAVNFHFNDVGLFGFRLTTSSDGSNRALDSLANHLQQLDKASDLHFLQAVKRLRHSVIAATENPSTRLQELLTQVSVFGESRLDQLLAEVDKLTVNDLTSFLRKTMGGKAALLVSGPNAGSVHSLSELKKLVGK